MLDRMVIFILISFFDHFKASQQHPYIQLSTGQIEGRFISNQAGSSGAFAYLGIPYAEPPVGDLRFARTVVKEQWKGVLQTKEYKPACWQNASISPQDSVSEDCLYINVFSGINCKTDRSCPIIFYIHGGANEFDSVNMFRPEILVDHFASRDLIFTTIGYRLGVLGFWTLGTKGANGNWLLYDLIEGLKWVQREIRNFGGDNGKVTIMGHSTGASIVALFSITEKSAGLFHQGIIMSESASKFEHLSNDLTDFRTLTKRVGCWPKIPQKTTKIGASEFEGILKCMRRIEPNILVNSMNELRCCDETKTMYAEQIVNFIALEQAKIELPKRIMYPRNDGPDGFFPEPLPVMRLKRRSIPVMIGSTINEYGHMNYAFDGRAAPYSVAQMCNFVVQARTYKNFRKIRKECKKNYALYAGYHERQYSRTNFSFWTRLQTSMFQEYQYFGPILREAASILSSNCSPVYLYSLDYEKPGLEGVFPFHSRDLSYVMDLHRTFELDQSDLLIRGIFVTLIVNFAKFGNPTPHPMINITTDGKTPKLSLNIKWEPAQCPDGSNYLSINLPRPAMNPFYHKNANWFWNRVAKDVENDRFNPRKSSINRL